MTKENWESLWIVIFILSAIGLGNALWFAVIYLFEWVLI